MLSENNEIDVNLLRALITRCFGEQLGDLRFRPLGEDSWSYVFGQLWVSVRRDVQGHSPSAYETAFRLHDEGWTFILAPLLGADGAVVRNLQRFPVVVFPFLDVRQVVPERPLTPSERADVDEKLAALHGSPGPGDLPVEDFELPFADRLADSVATARDGALATGPFGERLTRLVRHNDAHLDRLRAERDALAERLRGRDLSFVVTHGDLNCGNILRTRTGLMIADWGLMCWGPPERDWYHLSRTLGFPPRGDRDLLRYYHLRWQLSEIAEYATAFTAPHIDDKDANAMWRRLVQYLPESNSNIPPSQQRANSEEIEFWAR